LTEKERDSPLKLGEEPQASRVYAFRYHAKKKVCVLKIARMVRFYKEKKKKTNKKNKQRKRKGTRERAQYKGIPGEKKG